MIKIPEFKIHAHASGKIMGNVNKPTEKQLTELARLEAKGDKITDKQKETLAELIEKRDSKPEITTGAKTFCEQWLKEQFDFYNRRAQFSNKYTEKGIRCEPESIKMTCQIMGYGDVKKNEVFFGDDPDIIGTPDMIMPASVEDVKSSWDWRTFPLFKPEMPESDYFYQLQCYMAITGKESGAVNYCLINTPDEFIDREARSVSWKAGFEEVDADLYDEVYAKMTYDTLPLHLRFKRYAFTRDDEVIESIRTQVRLCRIYIATLCADMDKMIEAFQKLTPTYQPTIIINPEPFGYTAEGS